MPYKFTVVKQGYSPEEVEKYVNALEKKVKEYKEKENIIQSAIISAQTAADMIVKNAQAEALSTQKIVLKQMEELKESLRSIRVRADNFKVEYSELLIKYLVPINNDDFMQIENDFQKINDEIDMLTSSKLKNNLSYDWRGVGEDDGKVTEEEIAELSF